VLKNFSARSGGGGLSSV